MRTITRTGALLSVIAALALYGLQLVSALGAMLGVIAIGLLAGLSVAKWLERDWYGRQLEAGARAGVIACGIGGVSAALYLLGQGPRSTTELARRSHIAGIDFAPLVQRLDALGWVGVDLVGALLATICGITLAALTAQIAAWSKSKRSIRVITQARLAAQALQRPDSRGLATGAPGYTTSGPQLFASPSRRTGAPALASELNAWAGLPMSTLSEPLAQPAPTSQHATQHTSQQPVAPMAQQPLAPSVADQQPLPVPEARKPSGAHSADEGLSDDARAALEAWEESLFDDEPPVEPAREPKLSTFLTDPAPASRRKRKKQNTRDWLC